jgi:DNA-binding SARP family transcriptional activator/TolB-like protein
VGAHDSIVSAPRLQLRLLGHMAVHDTSGRSHLPRTRKTRALLGILAMASPKPVLRLHVATLLWSRREKEQAGASLRQSVHELQETLAPDWAHLFVTDRHHLSLRGAELDIDALAFAHPLELEPASLLRFEEKLLEDLDGLDPAFDRWLDEQRARFIRVGRTVGEGILAKCEDPVIAIDVAERMLAFDRTHEGAWRAIIRSHAERGDLGAATASYNRCRGVLAEFSDARPSPETEELIERIRAQCAPSGAPSAASELLRPAALLPLSQRIPARGDRLALRLRVMPFRSIGQEADSGLAIGLAEEVVAGLSRFRWISCVPPTLWIQEQGGDGPSANHAAMESDLVLEGTVQYGAGRVRTIVRLLDMRVGGEIVWAGRFDRAITDSLTLQDELSAAIVAQVDPELMQHEGRRTAASGAQQDMTAQDLLLQALPGIYRLDRASFTHARRLLERSLQADPGSSVAHGWLAYWDLLYVGQGWSVDPAASAAEAARLAERAVMLDPGDARALTLAGHVRGFLGRRPEEAIALHERAIALNPNLAIAWCFSGLAHVYTGRHDEGLRRIMQACRLSPSDPHGFFFDTALLIAHLLRGEYGSAVVAGRRAVELNPLFSSGYKSYVAALGLMDRTQEAAEVLARLLKLEPDFTVEAALLRSPFTQSQDLARYAEGLRRAGLRENTASGRSGQSALTIENSLIDLEPDPPHSPVLLRD